MPFCQVSVTAKPGFVIVIIITLVQANLVVIVSILQNFAGQWLDDRQRRGRFSGHPANNSVLVGVAVRGLSNLAQAGLHYKGLFGVLSRTFEVEQVLNSQTMFTVSKLRMSWLIATTVEEIPSFDSKLPASTCTKSTLCFVHVLIYHWWYN